MKHNLSWSSWATTHTGKRRKVNQDAFINLPDKQLWAVADGMGGHQSGEYASAALAKALTELTLAKNLGSKINGLYGALSAVNRELLILAEERGHNTVIGSTVTILLAECRHCVCLWSGDSRIYLLRHGKLRQLSRDHSYETRLLDEGYSSEEIEHQPFKQTLTHAVGIDTEFYLEAQIQEIQPGDKFLLCSDGLTKEIPETVIELTLATRPGQQAMTDLLDQTLAAGARDNVTIMVVEASGNNLPQNSPTH